MSGEKIANIKEIKSIKLTSFTVMTSFTGAILAFVYALIILIISGILPAFVPQLGAFREIINGLGIVSIIILPISAYFLIMVIGFVSALLYNLIASRIGGIKLELKGNEIIRIPMVRFSIILGGIEAIWAFIVGLFLAAAIIPFTSIISTTIHFIVNNIANAVDVTGITLLIDSVLGTNGFKLAFILIIGFPLVVFLFGLVSNALFALFYNYVATKVIKIQLDIESISGTLNEVKSLPVVPSAAPVSGAVFGAFGVIMGCISLLSLAVTGNPSVGNAINDITVIVINGLSYFIGYFLIFALISVIYNFLVPIIGGIRLDLE